MAWNALWTILGVMLVFLALGVPISYSIGISSLAAILATVSADAAVVTAAQRIFVGMARRAARPRFFQSYFPAAPLYPFLPAAATATAIQQAAHRIPGT